MDVHNLLLKQEFGIPSFLYLVTRILHEEHWSRTLNYYFFQSLKINYYLLFGTGSARVGTIATRFNLFMRDNWQKLTDDLIWDLYQTHFGYPFPLKLGGKCLTSHNNLCLSWISSSNLMQYSKGGVCKISNLATLFSKDRADPVDWRSPMPTPDFPMYNEVNKMVEQGIGFWIPYVDEELKDVGFTFFEKKTNNIL